MSAVTRRLKSLWLGAVCLLGLLAADCGNDRSWVTMRAVDSVYASAASTPTSQPPRDGWGQRLQVAERDSSLMVISAGPDGSFGTADDLDFSPDFLAARAARVVGCWRTESMAYPVGRIHSLRLRQTKIEDSPHLRGDVNAPSADLRWVPWGQDSIVMFLLTGPQMTEVRALATENSLEGSRIIHGELLGWRRKRQRFSAQRIACAGG